MKEKNYASLVNIAFAEKPSKPKPTILGSVKSVWYSQRVCQILERFFPAIFTQGICIKQ